MWFLAGVSHPCGGFGYNQYCDQKRAVCVSLVSVSHHVVLVTTHVISVPRVFKLQIETKERICGQGQRPE